MGLINYWRRTPRRVLQRIFPKWKRVSLEGKKRNWKLIGIEQTIDLIRSKNRTFVFSYSYDCERYSQQPKDRDSTTTEGKKRAPSASTFLNFCITSWFWICVAFLSRMGCLGGGARGGWGQEVSQTCCWPKGQEEKSGCKHITPTTSSSTQISKNAFSLLWKLYSFP